MGVSESELMTRIQSGDSMAFTELDSKWRPVLFGLFLRRVRIDAEAEDLVQKTLLKVWLKCDLFDETKGSFTSWIKRIANGVLIDTVRGKQSEKRGGTIHHESVDFHEHESYHIESCQAEVNESVEIVREIVSELPPILKRPIEAYLDGQETSSIAVAEGISSRAIVGRLRLARQRMRGNIELATMAGFLEETMVAPILLTEPQETHAKEKRTGRFVQLTLF